MAKKGEGSKFGGPGGGFEKHAFDDAFLTPLNERKVSGKDPRPDVFNIPVLGPTDPLNFVPGGTAKGKMTKGK